MKTKEDVESYLIRAELPYEEVGDGMWVIHSVGEVEQIVVKVTPPLVVFRVNVMNIPKAEREECFRVLLELNASDMIHGAYGIEGDKIVIADCLQLENLDFNEFQATLDDMTMAVANHYSRLSRFRDQRAA